MNTTILQNKGSYLDIVQTTEYMNTPKENKNKKWKYGGILGTKTREISPLRINGSGSWESSFVCKSHVG